MNVYKVIMPLLLLSPVAYAASTCEVDRNSSTENIQDEFNYIDDTHRSISGTVVEWADKIDTKISCWLGNVEENSTRVPPRIPDISNTALENQVKVADAFFQIYKYLNETEDIFIRVRTGATF